MVKLLQQLIFRSGITNDDIESQRSLRTLFEPHTSEFEQNRTVQKV